MTDALTKAAAGTMTDALTKATAGTMTDALTKVLTRDDCGKLGFTLLEDNTVSTVHPGTAGSRAGLVRGDLVVSVNGVEVSEDNGAFHELKRQSVSRLELRILRGDGNVPAPLAKRKKASPPPAPGKVQRADP
eukprot:5980480-Prymnesium_polylepis.1